MAFRGKGLTQRFGLRAGAATPGRSAWTALILAAVLALAMAATGLAGTASTERVSVGATGEQGNSVSFEPAISADGRYVAFVSRASNLVPRDTNRGNSDVFVRDRTLHTTETVSVASTGKQVHSDSFEPAISAHGRYVAFKSRAPNLVAGDTNKAFDVFVRDRKLQTTRRVSVSSTGQQGNLRADSVAPAISANGRYVAFESDARHLVAGDTNRDGDVFVRDRKLHTTRRVSVPSRGRQAGQDSGLPAISANGRYVTFESRARHLVAGDTNRKPDVFVRDRKLHKTRRVSVSSTGEQGNDQSFEAAISTDGRYVAFDSRASNLVAGDTNEVYDVFVRDRKLHTTRRVSVASTGQQGNDESFEPTISADGRYVAFVSRASNLVAGEANQKYDVFVRDRKLHTTRSVSVSSTAEQGNDDSFEAAISADGRYVVFRSLASNLVAGDTNGWSDVFVRGPLP